MPTNNYSHCQMTILYNPSKMGSAIFSKSQDVSQLQNYIKLAAVQCYIVSTQLCLAVSHLDHWIFKTWIFGFGFFFFFFFDLLRPCIIKATMPFARLLNSLGF